MIGNGETLWRLCGIEEETRTQLVFGYGESYALRLWNWSSWEELDDRGKWQYIVEGEGGKMVVRDKVEDFFVALNRAIVGMGPRGGLGWNAVGVGMWMCVRSGIGFFDFFVVVRS